MTHASASASAPGTPTVAIPASLLPADGRFGSGPSKVRPEAVAALAGAADRFLGTSHRQEPVKEVVRRVRHGLAELFALPEGYEVLLGNGGATAFWDAAAFGLVENRSRHLVCGEFSSKFAAVTAGAPHLADPQVVGSDPGSRPPHSAGDDPGAYDAYAYPHNETSTGVMLPVERPDGLAAGTLVLVDATSAAGGARVAPSAFDAYFFAPQKCFSSDGGLWLALCSPAAVERIERLASSGRWVPPSLDLSIALGQSRLDQTYNTPALATLYLLAEQVGWMLEHGGMEFSAGRCERSSSILYGWAEAHPLVTPYVGDPAARSTVTATLDLDASVDAPEVCRVLRAHGIVDVEPYRKLGRNQIRVATFPSIEPADVEALTRCLDVVIEALAA
ncbi:MAG: phosphoserine transaminase [Acidimicrobiia bacterium]|nr:phosphoserine transaminase [Acidimicrobiia bacterium]